jgi:hypothetical protein
MSDSNENASNALDVNEATLELLQRRLEARVRSDFFRSVGLPIGGAGLIAILFALFVWIPDKLDALAEQPTIRAAMEDAVSSSVDAYLADPERGGMEIRLQVQRSLPRDVERALVRYFEEAEGRGLVQDHVAVAAKTHLQSPESNERVDALLEAFLGSDAFRDLLVEVVNKEIRPKLAELSQRLGNNQARLVSEVRSVEDVASLDKASLDTLHSFLDSPPAAELRSAAVPLALTKRIRNGPVYDYNVIEIYLQELADRFGDQFDRVLLLDHDGVFLASAPPALARQRLDALMPVLNAGRQELTREEAVARLADVLGPAAVRAISAEKTVREALENPAWAEPDRLDARVPVVDGAGRFLGTSSRRQLLHVMLEGERVRG